MMYAGPTLFIGLDDTDTLDTPGTNQLARHLVRELEPELRGQMILRHQLLEDPRVPCTKKNGCASIEFQLPLPSGAGFPITDLASKLRNLILDWIPPRSDPGFAIATSIPAEVADWGHRAQRELVTQREARELAAAHGIHLEGLAGTQDGVIGALAAIGLMSTRNDGRVVYFAADRDDNLDVTGILDVSDILARGIQQIVDRGTNEPLTAGTIEVGKKLRPNLRSGQIVLFARRRPDGTLEAIRVS
jgi:tRNA(Ile2) C34 agmatinyltransferase TiaS